MGTITPKYRIEANYVCFITKQKAIATFAQDTKLDSKGLAKWREGMNKSMAKGGANEHLAKRMSAYSRCRLILQATAECVAEYNPPMFEMVD